MIFQDDDSARRNDLQVAADILRIAEVKNGASKTAIMYGANLSFSQTQKYLARLQELELLEIGLNKRRRSFKLLDRGRRFLVHVDALESFLAEPQAKVHITSRLNVVS